MKIQDLTLQSLRDLIREIVLEILETQPPRKTQAPRQGWQEQFAAATIDTHWLDVPLITWDDTEWTG